MRRTVQLYGARVIDFLESLGEETAEKLEWTIALIQELDIVPIKYLKYLKGSDGIYEIRFQWQNKAYRLCCFFDNAELVIIHCFIKKTQKTPYK